MLNTWNSTASINNETLDLINESIEIRMALFFGGFSLILLFSFPQIM